MKSVRLALVLVIAAAGIAGRALAWDEVGHLQVADLAWARLSDKAKKEIGVILMAGDPRFRPATAAETDVRAAFRKTAAFPDFIKYTKDSIYEDSIESMNKTFFVTSPPNPADSEDERCKTWHYYDVPIRDTGKHAPKESNALVALAKARTEIAALEGSPTPDRKMQCWWLSWIEHLTGDLHQPLHCVSNYQVLPEGDAGGNLFMIKNPAASRPARLHGYWDGGIGRAIAADKAQSLSPSVEDVSQRWSTDYAPAAADAANLEVLSWIKMGAQLADSMVYVGIEKDQQPTKGYEQTQIALCRRQAVLAGARLAAILNDTLGK